MKTTTKKLSLARKLFATAALVALLPAYLGSCMFPRHAFSAEYEACVKVLLFGRE